MQYFSKGGYSEVFYDTEHRDIYRQLPRLNKEKNNLEMTSFNDLIFTKSFDYTNFTPIIYDERISKNHISYHMPHYGETLHHWVKNNSLETRQKYAAYILLQIIAGCLYFEKNAYFHSDIKPLNIMIETIYEDEPNQPESNEEHTRTNKNRTKQDGRGWHDDSADEDDTADSDTDDDDADDDDADDDEAAAKSGERDHDPTVDRSTIKDLIVRIIDFNISSVRVISMNYPTMDWAYTIGTWNYSPPEIVLHDSPRNNSISWTIGLLAGFIIDKYPFSDHITMDMDRKLVNQDTWSEQMEEWHKYYPEHPPLSRKEWYSEPWRKLIYACTEWDDYARVSIGQIYNYIYEQLLEDKYKTSKNIFTPSQLENIQLLEYPIEIVKIDIEKRKQLIDLLFSLCEHITNMNIFPTAVAIFDRCLSKMDEKHMKNIDCFASGAFILSCFMNNCDVLCSNSTMSYLFTTLNHHTETEIMIYMYHVGDLLQWRLWEKPIHIYVIDHNYRLKKNINLFNYIYKQLLTQHSVYSQKIIAQKVIEMLNH